MTSSALLTIAIPTFQRANSAYDCVNSALEGVKGLPAKVLVSDNASLDHTIELLQTLTPNKILHVIQKKRNSGWAGNISTLLREADTEYLLLLSDEDNISSQGRLKNLIDFLIDWQPEVVSASREGKQQLVESGSRFWDLTQDMSGLILRRDVALKLLNQIEALAENPKLREGWEIYPQVMLVAGVWLKGGSFVEFGQSVVEMREKLPTQWQPNWTTAPVPAVRSRSALPVGQQYYRSIQSRISQQEALAAWVEHLRTMNNAALTRARFDSLRNFQGKYVVGKLLGDLEETTPTLYPQIQEALLLLICRRFLRKGREKILYELLRFRSRLFRTNS